MLVAKSREASSRLSLDDRECRVNALLPLQSILLGLGLQVVDVIEHDLVKVADSWVEVARDCNVQNQCQAIAPRSLHAKVSFERDDRFGCGSGADYQVGRDECLVEQLEWHGMTVPASCGA